MGTLRFALPCIALPWFALPCLALACFALPSPVLLHNVCSRLHFCVSAVWGCPDGISEVCDNLLLHVHEIVVVAVKLCVCASFWGLQGRLKLGLRPCLVQEHVASAVT